jgi:hypothetical protein
MKSLKHILFITLVISVISCKKTSTEVVTTNKTPKEFYQLKTYLFDTDFQVQATDAYLKNAYMPALKKLNINNIGVFKPRPNDKDSIRKIHVLTPFSSIDQFLNHEKQLKNDSLYLNIGSDYINASHKNPPFKRIESILLRAFEDMPNMKTPELEGAKADRIYELRSYESATEKLYHNKVDMFNAGGEIKLFDHLEFNAVFFAEVVSGSKMPNLMYMTTFEDQKSRDQHWKAFSKSPEWTALKSNPKYQNNVSHADIMFLYPTEYSDY